MSSTMPPMSNAFDDEPEEGLSGFTILAIVVSLLLVFILVVMYAYRQGVASRSTLASEELPVVAADPRPVAEDVPVTGGAVSPRQEVYDRLAGAKPSRIITQEDPRRDALNGYGGAPADRNPRAAQGSDTTPLTTRRGGTGTDKIASASAASRPVPQQKPAVTTSASSVSRSSSGASQAAVAPSRRDAPARASSSSTARTPAAPPTPAASASAVSGTHVVQVGAFDSNGAALSYFNALGGRLGSLIAGKKPDVQSAVVNGRTYHRLRIGPFSSRSDATAYCNRLKANGQDCLVRGV